MDVNLDCRYVTHFFGNKECLVFIGRKAGKSEGNSLQGVETEVYYSLKEARITGPWSNLIFLYYR